MAVLKVKHSPACWCLQKPGKTPRAAHHHRKLSISWTPPLWWSHCPKHRFLDPGPAQPSGLVRDHPELPADDTNKEDIWIAFLFDVAKPPLCLGFPSSECCADVFKEDWQWNVWHTPEMLKTLRSAYVVYRENGPKFASSHWASLWIVGLQTKERKSTLACVTLSGHSFSLIHMEQVQRQVSSQCHFSIILIFISQFQVHGQAHTSHHMARFTSSALPGLLMTLADCLR